MNTGKTPAAPVTPVAPTAPVAPLLSFDRFSLRFAGPEGSSHVLDDVRLDVMPGEILGLVGESGCGKSVLARSALRLLPSPPALPDGRILFRGEDLLKASPRRLRAVRGGEISMIFQEPMSSLNPVFTVGAQMTEVLRLHRGLSAREARARAAEMLRRVRMPDPEQTLGKYPHELSGGMRQRVMIAMELSCGPALLMADEPTTALDVTVQGQVLALLAELTREQGVSTLFITHDMGVVAQLCERVAVMYAGTLVELAPVDELFRVPLHPYTRGLIAAIPRLDGQTQKDLPYIPGSVPDLRTPPTGCRFHPRCALRSDICLREKPPMRRFGAHGAACHHLDIPAEVPAQTSAEFSPKLPPKLLTVTPAREQHHA